MLQNPQPHQPVSPNPLLLYDTNNKPVNNQRQNVIVQPIANEAVVIPVEHVSFVNHGGFYSPLQQNNEQQNAVTQAAFTAFYGGNKGLNKNNPISTNVPKLHTQLAPYGLTPNQQQLRVQPVALNVPHRSLYPNSRTNLQNSFGNIKKPSTNQEIVTNTYYPKITANFNSNPQPVPNRYTASAQAPRQQTTRPQVQLQAYGSKVNSPIHRPYPNVNNLLNVSPDHNRQRAPSHINGPKPLSVVEYHQQNNVKRPFDMPSNTQRIEQHQRARAPASRPQNAEKKTPKFRLVTEVRHPVVNQQRPKQKSPSSEEEEEDKSDERKDQNARDREDDSEEDSEDDDDESEEVEDEKRARFEEEDEEEQERKYYRPSFNAAKYIFNNDGEDDSNEEDEDGEADVSHESSYVYSKPGGFQSYFDQPFERYDGSDDFTYKDSNEFKRGKKKRYGKKIKDKERKRRFDFQGESLIPQESKTTGNQPVVVPEKKLLEEKLLASKKT